MSIKIWTWVLVVVNVVMLLIILALSLHSQKIISEAIELTKGLKFYGNY